jgi:hypothetical protein
VEKRISWIDLMLVSLALAGWIVSNPCLAFSVVTIRTSCSSYGLQSQQPVLFMGLYDTPLPPPPSPRDEEKSDDEVTRSDQDDNANDDSEFLKQVKADL